jgi:hypothetical protein
MLSDYSVQSLPHHALGNYAILPSAALRDIAFALFAAKEGQSR